MHRVTVRRVAAAVARWWAEGARRRIALVGVAAVLVIAAAIPLALRGRDTQHVTAGGRPSDGTSTSAPTETTGSDVSTTTQPELSTSTTEAKRATTTSRAATTTTEAVYDVLPIALPLDVAASSPSVAWVRGATPSNGVAVARTTDGGRTWRSTCFAGAGGAATMSFVDDRHGWVIAGGTAPVLYGTTDGGATWTATPTGVPVTSMWQLLFADQSHGWLLFGDPGRPTSGLARTTDGGRSWTSTTLPIKVNGLAFNGPLQGVAVGEHGGTAAIAVTNDGGVTWTDRHVDALPAPRPDSLSAVALGADGVAWAVGASHTDEAGVVSGPAVLRSADGGATWATVDGAGTGNYRSVRIVGTTVWIGGQAPGQGSLRTVIRSGSATTPFVDRYSASNTGSFQSLVEAGGHLWASGLQVGLVRSGDAGATWAPVARSATTACP